TFTAGASGPLPRKPGTTLRFCAPARGNARLVRQQALQCFISLPCVATPSTSSSARTRPCAPPPTSCRADGDVCLFSPRDQRALRPTRLSSRGRRVGARRTDRGTRGGSPLPRAEFLRGAISRRVVPAAAVPLDSNRPQALHRQ